MVAMAAVHTVRSMFFQLGIMVSRHCIPGQGEIIILVDQAHVQARGAGLAVVAVDAVSNRISGRKCAENAVVFLLRRSVKEAQL